MNFCIVCTMMTYINFYIRQSDDHENEAYFLLLLLLSLPALVKTYEALVEISISLPLTLRPILAWVEKVKAIFSRQICEIFFPVRSP